MTNANTPIGEEILNLNKDAEAQLQFHIRRNIISTDLKNAMRLYETTANKYYARLHKCGRRYWDMLHNQSYTSKDTELYYFILQFLDGVSNELPLMKLNRWLGYIQGCLIERGYTDVETERNWTRPLFKELDFHD